nr:gliding motility-associated C-terminal domain-containing protein [Bacteroidota bacterium]
PYTHQWSEGQSSSEITEIKAGEFIVTTLDANKCSLADTISLLDVLSDECLFIPNAFSPNGDGDHDMWVIENMDSYTNVKVEVYNRWGNIVFSSNDYANDWDGKRNGNELPGGVYFYSLDFNNGQKPKTGSLTLIR